MSSWWLDYYCKNPRYFDDITAGLSDMISSAPLTTFAILRWRMMTKAGSLDPEEIGVCGKGGGLCVYGAFHP